MNKKGFTLIELLMVIALIGVLSLILVPNVITLTKKNNIESCKNIEKNIINAAKMYVSENKYEMNFNCTTGQSQDVSLQKLIDFGKLSNLGENPVTKESISPNLEVEITYDCNNKTFSYDFDLDCE